MLLLNPYQFPASPCTRIAGQTPASYRLEGDELIFDRSLGRPRNAVVLPDGWYLTASSIPAKVTQMKDGRIRLDFWNGRPDAVDVLIKAKRREH